MIRPAAFAAGLAFFGVAGADISLEPKPAEIMPKAAESILNDIVRIDGHYVAVGDRGHVLRSEDGDRWEQVPTPVQAMLIRARFLNPDLGWAVGHDGTVLRTEDGARSWQLIHSDTEWGKPLYDVLFLNPRDGFIVGANAMFKRTRDGGQSWELLEPDFTIHGLHINTILKLADGTMVVSGEKGTMARSLDDGETWEQVQTPYAGSFFGMVPYGDAGVFLFGLRGNVYSVESVRAMDVQDSMEWDEFSLQTVTDNQVLAEAGWRYYPNDLKESLFGGVKLDARNVLLVGVNGAVVRSRNGRMEQIQTGLEHTLGSALLTDEALITVGLAGIQAVPVEAR